MGTKHDDFIRYLTAFQLGDNISCAKSLSLRSDKIVFAEHSMNSTWLNHHEILLTANQIKFGNHILNIFGGLLKAARAARQTAGANIASENRNMPSQFFAYVFF